MKPSEFSPSDSQSNRHNPNIQTSISSGLCFSLVAQRDMLPALFTIASFLVATALYGGGFQYNTTTVISVDGVPIISSWMAWTTDANMNTIESEMTPPDGAINSITDFRTLSQQQKLTASFVFDLQITPLDLSSSSTGSSSVSSSVISSSSR